MSSRKGFGRVTAVLIAMCAFIMLPAAHADAAAAAVNTFYPVSCPVANHNGTPSDCTVGGSTPNATDFFIGGTSQDRLIVKFLSSQTSLFIRSGATGYSMNGDYGMCIKTLAATSGSTSSSSLYKTSQARTSGNDDGALVGLYNATDQPTNVIQGVWFIFNDPSKTTYDTACAPNDPQKGSNSNNNPSDAGPNAGTTTTQQSCGAWWHIACHFSNVLKAVFVPSSSLTATLDSFRTAIADHYPFGPIVWAVGTVHDVVFSVKRGVELSLPESGDGAPACSTGADLPMHGLNPNGTDSGPLRFNYGQILCNHKDDPTTNTDGHLIGEMQSWTYKLSTIALAIGVALSLWRLVAWAGGLGDADVPAGDID